MSDDVLRLMIAGETAARDYMIDTKNKLPPTWLLVTPEKPEIEVVLTPWRSTFERKIMLAQIRQQIAALRVTAYGVISEAWLISRELAPGEIFDGVHIPSGWTMPRNDPKRREVVHVFATDRTERRQTCFEIVRDYKGTVRMLRADEKMSGVDSSGGALARMLSDEVSP